MTPPSWAWLVCGAQWKMYMMNSCYNVCFGCPWILCLSGQCWIAGFPPTPFLRALVVCSVSTILSTHPLPVQVHATGTSRYVLDSRVCPRLATRLEHAHLARNQQSRSAAPCEPSAIEVNQPGLGNTSTRVPIKPSRHGLRG